MIVKIKHKVDREGKVILTWLCTRHGRTSANAVYCECLKGKPRFMDEEGKEV
uniref:Uncharacterized protein n=1 Tax=viral metagenome TaxID=1070528 RepID=A0A6M3LS73_9ZZZZ